LTPPLDGAGAGWQNASVKRGFIIGANSSHWHVEGQAAMVLNWKQVSAAVGGYEPAVVAVPGRAFILQVPVGGQENPQTYMSKNGAPIEHFMSAGATAVAGITHGFQTHPSCWQMF